MHRPKTPQLTTTACRDDVVIMSFPPTCTPEAPLKGTNLAKQFCFCIFVVFNESA